MIIRIWDNEGKTLDRYTIMIQKDYFIMSQKAGSPQGVNQYIGSWPEINEKELGKLIMNRWRVIESLPHEIRVAIGKRTQISLEGI
jgi:hypothetical protein